MNFSSWENKKIFYIVFGIISCVIILSLTFKPVLKCFYPVKYMSEIEKFSQKYGIKKELVTAMISTESKFRKNAISHKNAKGLMQLKEETAKWCIEKYDIDENDETLYSPRLNIETGCAYMRYLLDKFGGNLGTNGSVNWMFDKKGCITFDAELVDYDALFEAAINLDAEDIVEEMEILRSQFDDVRQKAKTAKDPGFYIGKAFAPEGMKIEHPEQIFQNTDASGKIFLWGAENNKKIPGDFRAVTTFLENECGIRWLWPAASGEVVPRKKSIQVEVGLKSDKPAFAVRILKYGSDATWNRRMKLGQSMDYRVGHAFKSFIDPKDYFKTHPEYFGLFEGKRIRRCQ